jgi:hypothetical protein
VILQHLKELKQKKYQNVLEPVRFRWIPLDFESARFLQKNAVRFAYFFGLLIQQNPVDILTHSE